MKKKVMLGLIIFLFTIIIFKIIYKNSKSDILIKVTEVHIGSDKANIINKFFENPLNNENLYIPNEPIEIYLYGADFDMSDRSQEYALWEKLYKEYDMRYLFFPISYFDADILNTWMKAEDNELLNEYFYNSRDLRTYSMYKFYVAIKTNLPETVFVGVDIGHGYETRGAKYLEYLESIGKKDSEEYKLTLKSIEQGKDVYEQSDFMYREKLMTENFIFEANKLYENPVVGIFYYLRADPREENGTFGFDNMAVQLKEHYGDVIRYEKIESLNLELDEEKWFVEENITTPFHYIPSESTKIVIVGEYHGVKEYIEKEYEMWENYYNEEGMRHLFLELPYYTAEFLNIWMKEEDNSTLLKLYNDWGGTSMKNTHNYNFFLNIKENLPETIFHGTDVGHQYKTTGTNYLNYLRDIGEEDSEEYELALENILQGSNYYSERNDQIREQSMVENFIREYDKIKGEKIMGIYGDFHASPVGIIEDDGKNIDAMAKVLKSHYGDIIEYYYIGALVEIQ